MLHFDLSLKAREKELKKLKAAEKAELAKLKVSIIVLTDFLLIVLSIIHSCSRV